MLPMKAVPLFVALLSVATAPSPSLRAQVQPSLITEPLVLSWKYSAKTDFWRKVSKPALSPRGGPNAVWTGEELIVYGGSSSFSVGPDPILQTTNYFDGARYRPSSDTWRPINSPGPVRSGLSIWTGTNALFVGRGRSQNSILAASYDPASDNWKLISSPPEFYGAASVWTGSEWIISARINNVPLALRYSPANDTWKSDNQSNSPEFFLNQERAVWTGRELIVWAPGFAFNPLENTWRALNVTNAPRYRYGHSAVWTGKEMLIFGGQPSSHLYAPDFDRYDPVLDQWTKGNIQGAPPSARFGHTAVWTGKEMIIFGGRDENQPQLNGGRYNPLTDTWSLMNQEFVPLTSSGQATVWTGSEMIFWGGQNYPFSVSSAPVYNNNTWIYNPESAIRGILVHWSDPSWKIKLERIGELQGTEWNEEQDRVSDPSTLRQMILVPSHSSEFFRLKGP
jgi:N-acetylneuraminic acid mutarotase